MKAIKYMFYNESELISLVYAKYNRAFGRTFRETFALK